MQICQLLRSNKKIKHVLLAPLPFFFPMTRYSFVYIALFLSASLRKRLLFHLTCPNGETQYNPPKCVHVAIFFNIERPIFVHCQKAKFSRWCLACGSRRFLAEGNLTASGSKWCRRYSAHKRHRTPRRSEKSGDDPGRRVGDYRGILY